MALKVNSKLENWDDVLADLRDKPVLLLGNGASRAIWDKFKYDSLFDLACDTSRLHHLTKDDRELFRHLDDTRNFEQVLSSLSVAKKINQICSLYTGSIEDLYKNIRQCLFSAVNDIHVPYAAIPDDIKRGVKEELARYRAIFTTNYDLIAYWSYMHEGTPFKDFFWEGDGTANIFDPGNSMLYDDATAIYYLHGALHLYKGKGNYTSKHVSNDAGASLLDLIRDRSEVPLFISEGSSRDKKAAILDNDYLAFAYRMFCQNRVNLVVFGQSLNQEYDDHIVEAIRRMRGWNRSNASNVAKFQVAISIYPGSDVQVVRTKSVLLEAFEGKDVRFFNSKTHPLGSTDLSVG